MFNKLITLIHTLTPHHLLSRFVGILAHSKQPWVKNTFIKWFVKQYKVDMTDAKIPNPAEFESFNAFFTRELKSGARSIDQAEGSIASPVDGAVSQIGTIENGQLIQAKGMNYELLQLLGGDQVHAALYKGGKFATLYLAPKDYHRVHMPVSGTLEQMVYVPGRIFSVNQFSAAHVPNLFARNERVICRFATNYGKMALVLVGAMIVASIKTVWEGIVAPHQSKSIKTWDYSDKKITLEKGDEMGAFQLGSTVIMLLENHSSWDEALTENVEIRMGQKIGEFINVS